MNLFIFSLLFNNIILSYCLMGFSKFFELTLLNQDPNMDLIDTDMIKQIIYEEIESEKKRLQNNKMDEIKKREDVIKNELIKNIRENIKKQLDIENENKKYTKYYEIVQKNNRKEINENNENEIIKFVENKINQNN